ncbi:MAG TPA: GntR family transcriptional regulator [Clostridiales bacterium]|nr:GntR family transcriptional regulator [Clostridiales bacterium]
MNDFKAHIPIYLQLINAIKQFIVSGRWPPGTRVPPVRELATQFGVNPNTMQRALLELERDGLIFTERTAGRFVTKDNDRIANVRQELCQKVIENAIAELKNLGFTEQEANLLLKTHHSGS